MLIALCSVKGSPGVTTAAVALAATWPHPESTRRLVAELDPAGGDLAVRFGLPATPGLVSLAAAARRTRDPAEVWAHVQALPGGALALVAPPGSTHARAALSTLAAAPDGSLLPAAAWAPGTVVIADCGRMDSDSPAEKIARRADALVLVTGTQGDDLAHVAARLSELASWTPRPGLLLAGEGYPTAEVERELGIPAIGRLPRDPVAVATLTGSRSPLARRRGRSGDLAREAAALARTLAVPARASSMPGMVPGVPAQLVRQPGAVAFPPSRAPRPQGPLTPPPLVRDPHRNGQQPASAGQEPLG